MKLLKKAKLSGIFAFIIVVLVVILLVYLIKNGWDMGVAAKDMIGLFGGGKK